MPIAASTTAASRAIILRDIFHFCSVRTTSKDSILHFTSKFAELCCLSCQQLESLFLKMTTNKLWQQWINVVSNNSKYKFADFHLTKFS